MYHMELLDFKKRKVILHRIHLHNANKLLFSVESQPCQGAGMSQGCAVQACAPPKQYRAEFPSPGETPSVCYFLLGFLTLMTGVQIEYSFCQIPGHTVRSDGEWVAYSPDTGQASREQPGCRDLPSVCTTPQPSCPSDLPHHN